MKILKAKQILICNESFDIVENCAIAFEEKIVKIGKFEELKKCFTDAEIYDYSDCVVAPAFINIHTHLEYSANFTSLVYGDFIKWLKSVISSRTSLCKEATNNLILEKIKLMQRSGVATIGEISSFGVDLESCAKSGARIIFFNEILGAVEASSEANWNTFIQRYERSLEFKSSLFTPAISVHSTYSTHPNLTKKACDLARQYGLIMSTHLFESDHEQRWINSANGEFKKFLSKFNKDPKPMYTLESFLSNFKNIRTLFTHCVYVNDFSKFDSNLHSITHCALSNRLLSKKTLNLRKLLASKLNFSIATDGLSSNISLNFFDELKANLLIHRDIDLNKLSKILWLGGTLYAAKSINFNLGEIKEGKIADIALYRSVDCDKDQLALQLLLQTKEAKKLFIGGNECKF